MPDANNNPNTNTEPTTQTDPIDTGNTKLNTVLSKFEDPDGAIRDLRKECASHRVKKGIYEDALKQILGVENLDGLNDKIDAYNATQAQKLKDAEGKTNSYIIESEISKAISEGYNEKLTRKLLDRSSIKVTDGKVEGLTEALKKLEEEYPEIKKTEPPKTADGTGTGKTTTSKDDEELAKFRKALGLK